MYRSVLTSSEIRIEIRRSLFIGRASPKNSIEEAEDWIAKIRSDEPTATHHCTAYTVGLATVHQKYDDNGEPKGTAGIPMLEVLKKEDLSNVCVVVTRYFGGIKLGAPGLVRAYTQACREAIHAARIAVFRPFQEVSVTFSYHALGKIEHTLAEFHEQSRNYGTEVSIQYLLPIEVLDRVHHTLLELTGGSVTWVIGEEKNVPADDAGHPLI